MSEQLTERSAESPLLSGGRIRQLRLKAGLTLQTLSEQAGISVGFLSQVERDKATPSLGTLAQLASALNVTLDYFIATPKPADSVTRQAERLHFAVDDSSLQYERLSTELPGGTLTSLVIHVPVGYQSELVSHSGEELVVIQHGVIRQTLDGNTFVLYPGDSMHFMGDTPHSFANIGDEPARLIWTGTTDRLTGRKQTPLRP